MCVFNFSISKQSFCLSAPSIIAIIVGCGLLLSLGLWQLDRAEQKRVIVQNIEKNRNNQLDLNQNFTKDLRDKVHYGVQVSGVYDTRQFIYDNNIHQGQRGYFVLTPLRFGKRAILVNRGFRHLKNRAELTKISLPVPNETIKIKGQLANIVKRFTLGDEVVLSKDFPQVIQTIQTDKFSKILGYELLPVMIELDPSATNGFVRDWQPFYGSVDKHIAYAVQWFAFAGIFLIIMLILHRKKSA